MINRNLHSPTKLTEFARNFDNEPENFLNKVVNRITNMYNSGYNTVNNPNPMLAANSVSPDSTESIRGEEQSVSDEGQQVESNADTDNDVLPDIPNFSNPQSNPSLRTLDDMPDESTPINVIQRICNIMETKKSNLTNYKDTELQQFWMPDSKSKECYECTKKFSTFRRKHHCRLCGQIFCSKCCSQVVPGKIINCSGDLKVCTYCSKIVLTYLVSTDINSDLRVDLQQLQDDLYNKFSSGENFRNVRSNISQSAQRKLSVGYQEERFVSKSNLSYTDRKELIQQHLNLLNLLNMTFPKEENSGLEVITFLISSKICANEAQAISTLNDLIENGYISQIKSNQYLNAAAKGSSDNKTPAFNENCSYKFMKVDDVAALTNRIFASSNENVTVPYLVRSDNATTVDGGSSDKSGQRRDFAPQEKKDNAVSTTISRHLQEIYFKHETLLLNQLLKNENLDPLWSKVLLPICSHIVQSVHPEEHVTELWDIRKYVNFKKLPGGSHNECCIISGTAFSKNVVHKGMSTRIEKPRILLLECPIIYQRVEGKYISIEALQLQEKEYLRNVVGRILTLKPNVLIVHKSVSGIAQDMLRSHGITLVLDVKLPVLDRLSRCFQCDIVSSIDSNIGRPKLGTCEEFVLKNYTDNMGKTKSIIVLKSNINLKGCPVILRGADLQELVKVKRVALLLLIARYNWRFELSFLSDEFAYTSIEKKIADDSAADQSEVNPTDSASDVTQDPAGENKFRIALERMLLSISPYSDFPLPYLETETGKNCALRSRFPAELYYSKAWSRNNEKNLKRDEKIRHEEFKFIHNFLSPKISTSIESKELQSSLANFRSSDGFLKKKAKHKNNI